MRRVGLLVILCRDEREVDASTCRNRQRSLGELDLNDWDPELFATNVK